MAPETDTVAEVGKGGRRGGDTPALLSSELCLARHNWVLMNFLEKSRGVSTRPDEATLFSLASPMSNHRHITLMLLAHCCSHLFSYYNRLGSFTVPPEGVFSGSQTALSVLREGCAS